MTNPETLHKRRVLAVDPPDPSWVPIRIAPFLFQMSLGTRGAFAPGLLPHASIDRLIETQVRTGGVAACKLDRETYRLVIGFAGGGPDREGWDEVLPHEARQHYASPDGGVRDGCEGILTALEAVWQTLVAGFRLAARQGHCKLFARIGSPCALHFTEIPASAFAHYDVVDWRTGHARSAADHVFELHVADARRERPTPARAQRTSLASRLGHVSKSTPTAMDRNIDSRAEQGPSATSISKVHVPAGHAYSVRDAAAISRVGRSTLYEAIRTNKLAARKFGRRTLILAPDLETWLATLPSIETKPSRR